MCTPMSYAGFPPGSSSTCFHAHYLGLLLLALGHQFITAMASFNCKHCWSGKYGMVPSFVLPPAVPLPVPVPAAAVAVGCSNASVSWMNYIDAAHAVGRWVLRQPQGGCYANRKLLHVIPASSLLMCQMCLINFYLPARPSTTNLDCLVG